MPAFFSCLLVIALLAGCADGSRYGAAAYANGSYWEARRYLTPPAVKGNPEAQYYLGMMSAHSLGGPRDPVAAARWFHKSAEQGFAKSQYNLGLLYATGRGVPRDENEAVKWLRLAADQGHPQAEFEWKMLSEKLAKLPKSDLHTAVDVRCPYIRFYADTWMEGGSGDSTRLSKTVLDTFSAALDGYPFAMTTSVDEAYWRATALVSRSERDHDVAHGIINMRAFADFEGKAMAYGHETLGETLEYGVLFEHAIADLDFFSRKSAEVFVEELLPHARLKCDDWKAGKLREEARLRAIRKELTDEIERIQRERAEAEAAAASGEEAQGRDLELRTVEPPDGLPPEAFE